MSQRHERTVATRLAVTGAEGYRRTMDQAGAAGQAALERVRDASTPASGGLLAVDAASREAQASMGRLASRAGPLGAALMALGPAGLAAAAGIGAAVAMVTAGARAMADFEQSTARLAAVQRATGQASGVLLAEIDDFARGLARATLTSRQEVLRASTALSTFRSVGREAFFDTLRLAQDLGAVFGGDLETNARLLGRALDDPIQGLSALTRVGITFTAAQRDAIQAMEEAGDRAGAQQAILEQLERRIGGAGAGVGLIGATDSLAESWRDLLLTLADAAPGRAATWMIEGLTDSLDSLNRAISRPDTWTALMQVRAEIAEIERELSELEASGAADGIVGMERRAADVRLRELRARTRNLGEQLRQEEAEQARDLAAAAEGQRLAAAERLAESLADIARRSADERYRIETDARQRALDEAQRDLERIRGMEAQGAPADAVAAALREREALLGAQIAEIDARAEESARRQAEAAARGAAAAAASRQQAIAALGRELELLETVDAAERARAQFLDQQVARLRGATAAEIAMTRDLAGAVYDLRAEREAEAAARSQAEQALERLAQDYRAWRAAAGGAEAALRGWRRETLAHADALGLQGERMADVARQVAALYAERLTEARRADLRASDDWRDGVTLALETVADRGETAAAAIERALTGAFGAGEDALVRMAMTGRVEIGDMVTAIAADLARLGIRQNITGPLAGALGSTLAGAWGAGVAGGAAPAAGSTAGVSAYGVYHQGGRVGRDPVPGRVVDPTIWAGAPRLHRGGLLPGERAIIAEDGEGVFTPRQMDAADRLLRQGLGRAGAAAPAVQVTVIDQRRAGAPVEVERQRGADGGTILRLTVRDMVRQDLESGEHDDAMSQRYGLRARGIG